MKRFLEKILNIPSKKIIDHSKKQSEIVQINQNDKKGKFEVI